MSFGFQFRDAAGNVTLTLDEALPRLIHSVRITGNYSGSFSVPDFDVNFGMFSLSPLVHKGYFRWGNTNGGSGSNTTTSHPQSAPLLPFSFNLDQAAQPHPDGTPAAWSRLLIFEPLFMPTVNWDNATKVCGVENPTAHEFQLNFIGVQQVSLP